MRKYFYVGYNIYPDLFIDADWYVPIPKKTYKENVINECLSMHDLQDRLPVSQGVSTLLPIAVRVDARTLANDIVAVQPMNGPRGILHYLDYVYSKTCSEDDAWYIWKIRRDIDHKVHASGRTIKKFYHVFAEPMTFFTNVRVGNEIRRVEQTPAQIRQNAEMFGIDYWAELESQANLV